MAENDSLVDGFKKLALDKPHYNLVFMGNVDAGKSTLCGQIMSAFILH